MEFPEEFEPQFYRAAYRDLGHLSDRQLRVHYDRYGMAEGRVASPAANRRGLVALIPPTASVLEIGPFCNPAVTGERVRYFDVLSQRELIARAQQLGRPHTKCPHIDFVSPTSDLSIVRDSFDWVVSCHCLEHQPDLVRHLAEVERILNRGGAYLVVVPDKRYCLDFFLAESTIADVVDAHARHLVVHSLRSVVEHRALVTHNDAKAHWRGEHGAPRASTGGGGDWVRAAIAEYEAANGAYVDVHAWRFTPQSFRTLLREMASLNYTRLELARVYGTALNAQEFCAILRRRAEG